MNKIRPNYRKPRPNFPLGVAPAAPIQTRKKVKDVACIAIRLDGTMLTGRHSTFFDAAAQMREWLRSPFFNDIDRPFKKLIMADGDCLAEYEQNEIDDPKNWTPGV